MTLTAAAAFGPAVSRSFRPMAADGPFREQSRSHNLPKAAFEAGLAEVSAKKNGRRVPSAGTAVSIKRSYFSDAANIDRIMGSRAHSLRLASLLHP